MSLFFAGLDLGQKADYTALIIAEQRNSNYLLRHIQRFPLGTPYPIVVRDVSAICTHIQTIELAIDATGVGAAVVDMFTEAQLPCPWYSVLIHGGDTVHRDGQYYYHVPKRDLVSTLQVLLQNKRVQAIERLPDAALLIRELQNFRVKIDPATAHDSYSSWREQQHDDLVLAAALALWIAEQLPKYQPTAGVWGR